MGAYFVPVLVLQMQQDVELGELGVGVHEIDVGGQQIGFQLRQRLAQRPAQYLVQRDAGQGGEDRIDLQEAEVFHEAIGIPDRLGGIEPLAHAVVKLLQPDIPFGNGRLIALALGDVVADAQVAPTALTVHQLATAAQPAFLTGIGPTNTVFEIVEGVVSGRRGQGTQTADVIGMQLPDQLIQAIAASLRQPPQLAEAGRHEQAGFIRQQLEGADAPDLLGQAHALLGHQLIGSILQDMGEAEYRVSASQCRRGDFHPTGGAALNGDPACTATVVIDQRLMLGGRQEGAVLASRQQFEQELPLCLRSWPAAQELRSPVPTLDTPIAVGDDQGMGRQLQECLLFERSDRHAGVPFSERAMRVIMLRYPRSAGRSDCVGHSSTQDRSCPRIRDPEYECPPP